MQNQDDLLALAKQDKRFASFLDVWLNWRLKKAMPHQIGVLDERDDINGHLVMGGRGAGKSASLSHEAMAYGIMRPKARMRAIAPTFADGRDTIVEGESGILAITPPECIEKWNRSMGELEFYNGSMLKIYSAEEPDRLRGSQSHRDFFDEIGAWCSGAGQNMGKAQKETWSMAMFGLRLPTKAKWFAATTPRPMPLLKGLLARKDVFVSRATTYDNLANLSENFRNEILSYEGTMLGRQEIHGEMVDMSEQGIFKKDWFRLWPADKPLPHFEYVVLSYDTGFKDTAKSAFSACTVWGVFRDQREGSSESHVLLIDCWREKIPYPDLRERALKNWRTWYGAADPELERHYVMSGRQIKGRQPDIMVVEDKGSGQSLIQDMRNEGINCWAYNPQKAGKEERAHIVSPLVKQGKVWIPESTRNRGHCMTWCEEWLEEVTMAPNCEYWDYTDCSVQCWSLLRDNLFLEMPRREEQLENDNEEAYALPTRANPYAG